MQATILFVEDNAAVAMAVTHALSREGWTPRSAATLQEARQALARTRINLVILDIGLPVTFLSARDDELDKVLGLELGGDDCLTKKFSVRELVSRVRALRQLTRQAIWGRPSAGLHPCVRAGVGRAAFWPWWSAKRPSWAAWLP